MGRRKKPRPEESNTLGAHFYRMGELDLAIAAFRAAVKKAPHRATYWSNLGTALIDAGDLSGAEEALNRALSLQPTHQAALYALGQLADLRGQSEQAMTFYRRVAEINPTTELGRRAEEKATGWRPPPPAALSKEGQLHD